MSDKQKCPFCTGILKPTSEVPFIHSFFVLILRAHLRERSSILLLVCFKLSLTIALQVIRLAALNLFQKLTGAVHPSVLAHNNFEGHIYPPVRPLQFVSLSKLTGGDPLRRSLFCKVGWTLPFEYSEITVVCKMICPFQADPSANISFFSIAVISSSELASKNSLQSHQLNGTYESCIWLW